MTSPHESVAATCCHAGTQTCISVIAVSVVTFLTGFRHTIAADRFDGTDRRAAVAVGGVAVVTFFVTGPDVPISTDSGLAGTGTVVRIVIVAVIAGLVTSPDVPVAAGCRRAGARATVGVDAVAVVAGLVTSPDVPVAAGCRRAGVETVISVGAVAIVAVLVTGPHESVAATCRHAGARAVVRIVIVAVIAGLAIFNHTVATDRVALGEVELVVPTVPEVPRDDDGISASGILFTVEPRLVAAVVVVVVATEGIAFRTTVHHSHFRVIVRPLQGNLEIGILGKGERMEFLCGSAEPPARYFVDLIDVIGGITGGSGNRHGLAAFRSQCGKVHCVAGANFIGRTSCLALGQIQCKVADMSSKPRHDDGVVSRLEDLAVEPGLQG